MTKEELKVKVAKQLSIINDANNEICSYVNDYIESLPYKVGDKVSCSRCDINWDSKTTAFCFGQDFLVHYPSEDMVVVGNKFDK